MNNCFVILAAGKSERIGKNLSKQFYKYKNKEIIDHSVEISLNSKLFKKKINLNKKIKLNSFEKILILLLFFMRY